MLFKKKNAERAMRVKMEICLSSGEALMGAVLVWSRNGKEIRTRVETRIKSEERELNSVRIKSASMGS